MKEDELTKDGKIKHWIFHPSRPYFFHDPQGYGFMYYATPEERDIEADKAIREYLDDDGWNEDVIFVMAGKITHRSTQTNITHRPEQLDNDKCYYELLPIEA